MADLLFQLGVRQGSESKPLNGGVKKTGGSKSLRRLTRKRSTAISNHPGRIEGDGTRESRKREATNEINIRCHRIKKERQRAPEFTP